MKQNSMFDYFLNGLDKNLQAHLSFYFQKQMMIEQFAKSREMQKMKDEITKDVLNRVSIDIDNKARQTLDDLFKNFNL